MNKRRVAITGLGAVSPFGWGMKPLLLGLTAGECALSALAEADIIGGMLACVGGKAPQFNEKSIPREHRRAMSRTGIMALMAASEALRDAGIEPSLPLAPEYRGMGSCLSATTVSPNTLEDFFRTYLAGQSVEEVRSTVFFKIMGHALPSNLNSAFGLSGRSLAPSAACATALQSLGLGYECIAFGKAGRMLCGGAEEFHPLLPATFDRLGAASHNTDPSAASRPFDSKRDGIVCSEGAAIFLLEDLEHAQNRGVRIIAEISGFGSNTSPSNLVFPDSTAIEACMRLALQDADLKPEQIDLVNAHATATEAGDIAEGQAIFRLFGQDTPVNSLKGYLGHCMAASGSLELAAAISAAGQNIIHGTRNLCDQDPRCGNIMLDATHKERQVHYILKNSFGLGGVNASLIIKIQKS